MRSLLVRLLFPAVLAAGLLAAAPARPATPNSAATRRPVPRTAAVVETTGPNAAGVRFQIERRSRGSTARINGRFAGARKGILEKLNRRDEGHLAVARTLVIPAEWDRDERDYAPLPRRWPAAAGHRKILVVHQSGQVFGAYERGQLVRWGPVSSGRRTDTTPPGLYHLTWKDTGHTSSENDEWFMPWYFGFEPKRGLSFHEYTLPGVPGSHACERMLSRDARWLYGWGEEWRLDRRGWRVVTYGTPVLVVGQYDFDAPPPWLSADWLTRTIDLPTPPQPQSPTASVVGSAAAQEAD